MRECLAPGPGFLEIKISFGECLHNKSIKDKAELSKSRRDATLAGSNFGVY